MGEEQQKLLRTTFGPTMCKLIEDGKIITKEHRYYGLKKAEQALRDVHTGAHNGKVVIMVAED